MKKCFKFIFLFLLVSCQENISEYCTVQDFICDSYLIEEGKLSIMQLKGEDLDELDAKLLLEKKDVIEEGDVLGIELYHPVRCDLVNMISSRSASNGFMVKDGKIFIPNVDYISVVGLDLDEATERIKKRFSEEIANVEIFVKYNQRVKKTVFISGVIAKQHPIEVNTRLFDVLSNFALSENVNLYKSYIMRNEKC